MEMNLKLHDYSSAIQSGEPQDLMAMKSDLGDLKSFRDWKVLLEEEFELQILSQHQSSLDLINYFYKLLQCDAIVGLLAGPCRNLVFYWPSGGVYPPLATTHAYGLVHCDQEKCTVGIT